VRTDSDTPGYPLTKGPFWYTRRGGVVRGPYPEQQVSRHILLGRIRENDELRVKDGTWATLEHYPHLIPEVMKLPPSEVNLEKLLLARLQADERRPRDRRAVNRRVAPDAREQRSGRERRCPEPEDMVRLRELKYQSPRRGASKRRLYRYTLVAVAMIALGFWVFTPSGG